MTFAITVEALDGLHRVGFVLLLWTPLGDVAKLMAIGALAQTAVRRLASIPEALKVLVNVLGPRRAGLSSRH